MGRKKTKVDLIFYLLLIFLAADVVLIERYINRRWNRLFGKPEIEVSESWDVELAEEVAKAIRRERGASASLKKVIKPLLGCPQARKKVKIDGYLNDPLWSRAGREENFTVYGSKGKRLAEKKTRVYLGHDRRNLYIGFLCRQAPAKYFRAIERRRTRERWEQESFGLLIDNSKEHDSYYRFGVNLNGTVAEAFKEDIDWKGKWSVETSYQDGNWIGEMAIPFSALGGIKPRIGDNWRINFYRRYNVGRKSYLSLWHGNKKNYLDPKKFPVLSFQKEAPQIENISLGSSLG